VSMKRRERPCEDAEVDLDVVARRRLDLVRRPSGPRRERPPGRASIAPRAHVVWPGAPAPMASAPARLGSTRPACPRGAVPAHFAPRGPGAFAPRGPGVFARRISASAQRISTTDLPRRRGAIPQQPSCPRTAMRCRRAHLPRYRPPEPRNFACGDLPRRHGHCWMFLPCRPYEFLLARSRRLARWRSPAAAAPTTVAGRSGSRTSPTSRSPRSTSRRWAARRGDPT